VRLIAATTPLVCARYARGTVIKKGQWQRLGKRTFSPSPLGEFGVATGGGISSGHQGFVSQKGFKGSMPFRVELAS